MPMILPATVRSRYYLFLLISLEDETPNVREEIWNLWSEVGKKWVEEEAKRDNKIKEQLDFQGAAEPPSHYPVDSNLIF